MLIDAILFLGWIVMAALGYFVVKMAIGSPSIVEALSTIAVLGLVIVGSGVFESILVRRFRK